MPEPERADPPLVVSQDGSGAVWTLTLNRPGKANALNAETVERLLAAIAEARTADARVLILGGPGAISAGASISPDTRSSRPGTCCTGSSASSNCCSSCAADP